MLAALLLLGGLPLGRAGAQQAADTGRVRTTAVVNRAQLSYATAAGAPAADSAGADVLVRHQAVALLAPSGAALVAPGERRVFTHQLVNQGTERDAFRLTATGPSGWPVALYVDADGDAQLGPGDAPVAAPLALERGAASRLLVAVDVPNDAADSATAVVRVEAVSAADPAVAPSAHDTVRVRRPRQPGTPPAAVALLKSVDKTEAAAGDTLRYTLTFSNRGAGPTPAPAALVDSLPAGLRVVAGSLRLGGAGLTDAADGDAGTVERLASGREIVRVALGQLAAGATGTLDFSAVLAAPAGGSIANVATLACGDSALTSAPAETRVTAADLEVDKTIVGADTVQVGGEARYELTFRNRSPSVAARDAVLADTLPPELRFVSASRPADVQGQVVRWTLGTLAPGERGSTVLVVRVERAGGEGGIVNVAALSAANARAATAAAARLTTVVPAAGALALDKRADVLDAALGEAIPYTVVVRNRGPHALAQLVVEDRLPDGTRFAAGRVVGADSVRLDAGDRRLVRFYVAGPLAPGGERVLRYAAVLAAPGALRVLENQAVAAADGGRVRSDTARAWVRVRGGYAMQARTLIGKVWLDRDSDGRQGPGDPGVAGVHVWSADGEVVTTDKEGRFSFRDVRPGTVALRLDTLGVPNDMRLGRAADRTALVRTDGWTTPRVNFRLVPQAAAAARTAELGSSLAAAGDGGAALGDAVRRAVERPGEAPTAEAPYVPPLRTADERLAEDQREFLDGAAVRITQPADGRVVGTNRVYVGVRGEAGSRVRLYDGARLIADTTVRPDGAQDFVSVELAPGPHRLRVWMLNSWRRERWDSVTVHRSGEPAAIEPAELPDALRADAPDSSLLRLGVLDQWRVPVATTPAVTVAARGATVVGRDADASSVGEQRRVAADGVLTLALRAGHDVGPGEVVLSAGKARRRVALRVLPFARPLIATGVGQLGVGAAPESFGALTVRGALGDETALSVSYDSRRRRAEDAFFARGYDPLDEARYPTLGDASERRVLAAGETRTLSARLERGFDWVQLGDVESAGFAGDGRLATYQRSLTGASARLTTGKVVWHGFGSVTAQRLDARQMRGDGGSGPYLLGGRIRPGTDRVAVEVRAADNAARVVARQELTRFVDYRVDYASGAVLLNRPVPAADPYGNPVFVVAVVERTSGGDARLVGGARAELDARRALGVRGVDSLAVGVSGVRDAGAASVGEPSLGQAVVQAPLQPARALVGAALHVERGRVAAGAEVLRAQGADSAAVATRARASYTGPGDRMTLEAGWTHVGDNFAAAADPRLSAGVDELRLAAGVKVSPAVELQLRHEAQEFRQHDAARHSTTLQAAERLAGRQFSQEFGLATDVQGAAAAHGGITTATGKLSVALNPRLDGWVEGSHILTTRATAAARPDMLGVGAAYRILPRTRVEAAHRFVYGTPDSSRSYTLTSLNLRQERILGGQLWGGVERAAADGAEGADETRASHAAVLGWNQRVSVAGGWSLSSLFERRVGLSRAPLVDPRRALPFAQAEPDRWSAALGVDWLPANGQPRVNAQVELRDGQDRRGHRVEVGGDAPLGRGAALITRHDWSAYRQSLGGAAAAPSRDERSLVGLAYRPVRDDRLNTLAKLEWRRTENPLGAVAAAGSQPGVRNERLIGAADAIWAANPRTEIAGRYAVRWMAVDGVGDGTGLVSPQAHYLGARVDEVLGDVLGERARLGGRLRTRLDARALLERASGTAVWNVAPSLALRVTDELDVEGGYRFGDLRDVDFAANGGRGLFATLAVRFTEDALKTPAAYWRERIGREP